MAVTPTKPIPLGFLAPDFLLPDVISGKHIRFEDIKGKQGTLVMFICNHCPYVKHVIHELVQLAIDYQHKGIGFVAINSNDIVSYPEDAPDKMQDFAALHRFPFPYLFDETQQTAKDYDAACTPDFNLFDSDDKCVYRGRLDGSRPGNDIPVTGQDMRQALDNLLRGFPISAEQLPSMGCNIKWKTNG
ncbi:MAG: thioredoxin family protein [Bacteroidales bacterium]|jgi:peroxiredoxin|nr:thioredoxin family protein [Bacteroidales bacterium]MDD3702497.1 thioredoxin family protein [Bacteroidales bacterium]MDY0368452.1 thioredoxin family protein [Bacteroidales bacterium]